MQGVIRIRCAGRNNCHKQFKLERFRKNNISEEIILRLAASEGGRVVKIRHEIKSSMESAFGDKNMSSLSKLLKTKN
jgi:hypothetical protein